MLHKYLRYLSGLLRSISTDYSDNFPSADGAFFQRFCTFGAGAHVPTFQNDTINGIVHANVA